MRRGGGGGGGEEGGEEKEEVRNKRGQIQNSNWFRNCKGQHESMIAVVKRKSVD